MERDLRIVVRTTLAEFCDSGTVKILCTYSRKVLSLNFNWSNSFLILLQELETNLVYQLCCSSEFSRAN